MPERVETFLARKKDASGADSDLWQRFEDLYTRKLWHELAVEVKTFMYTSKEKFNFQEFYDSFIHDFEHRINALELVEIILPVAEDIFKREREAAFEFLQKIGHTVRKDKMASIRVEVGKIKLKLENKDKHERVMDIDEVRKMIEDTRILVDAVVGVSEVHASFYKVSSIYLKEVGDYAGYYREALRYLGVEAEDNITAEEKHVHAVLLAFAALLGDNIYNLGELLAHPILRALENSAEHWILDMLYAFNAGDLPKFLALERYWGEWDDLKRRKDLLMNKIRLLAVMELALSRSTKDRTITFAEIAEKAQVDANEVERLVMRALSRNLMRGAMDEVKKVLHVEWSQPRVLHNNQLLLVANRINQWSADVSTMESLVTNDAREILTRA